MSSHLRATSAIAVFDDFASVLQCLRSGGDILGLRPSSSPGKEIVCHCTGGLSFAEAFLLQCSGADSFVRRLLFGNARVDCDAQSGELIATDGERYLNVVFDDWENSLDRPKEPQDGLFLYTDFKVFSFHRADNCGRLLEPFNLFNSAEMREEIEFNGSLWDSIYPTHFAIISRTLSCTFPRTIKKGSFFSAFQPVNALSEERAALDQLQCLQSLFTELLSVNEFSIQLRSSSKGPALLSEHRDGEYMIRRYSPQRSALFDFGMPAQELNRGDSVITYNIGEEEFHRDFFLSPRGWQPEDEELRVAAFDLIHTLAIRRKKLFRMGFGRRVYNVLLPPVFLADDLQFDTCYALFPCLNVYRTARHGFRRTVSITFLICPAAGSTESGHRTNVSSRSTPLGELYRLKADLLTQIGEARDSEVMKKYAITGPGGFYFKLTGKSTIPDMIREVSKSVFDRILFLGYPNDIERGHLVDSSVFNTTQESKMVTMALQVDWSPPAGFSQPWERWLATGDDIVFRNGLFRTLFYPDYFAPASAEASRKVVRFEDLNIGNTMGADMGGMTLYNPQECLKVVLYPKRRELYPNYSIVRWMSWHVYIDSALASMRALIYRFHPILEARGNLHSLISTLDEMIDEFVDFYDLAIRDYFYRKEYEKLRTLTQIDLDYAYLMSKFSSSKDDESLREQRLINKLILSLMISTVTVTVVSTIAQAGKMSMLTFVAVSVAASTLLVWVGYVLFDPLRASFRFLSGKINRLWR